VQVIATQKGEGDLRTAPIGAAQLIEGQGADRISRSHAVARGRVVAGLQRQLHDRLAGNPDEVLRV
jgi:hypothetical protein